MSEADKAPAGSGQRASDLLIIGGGVMGLWAAVTAARAGLDIVLVEEDRLGAGASGGLLGALMPHTPDRWNPKKQFQFEALVSLEGEIAALEAATGLKTGYRRCGRLIPLPKDHLRAIACQNAADAERNWQVEGRDFRWSLIDTPPVSGWPDEGLAASGAVFETLTARVSPRLLVKALEGAARACGRITIIEGQRVEDLDAREGRAILQGGQAVGFGHAIVSAGAGSFPLLDAVLHAPVKTGVAVKGQAALFRASIDPAFPVIYRDGLYIVPHEDGSVAVGSTSEYEFDDPKSTDDKLDGLIASARELVPLLADAPVIERWAGLRPRAIGRDPMVGAFADHPRLIALTGGFKISFGVAHALAKAAVEEITGDTTIDLPQSFRTETHVDLLKEKAPHR